MRGIYLSDEYEATKDSPKSGVGKKIQAQVRTLCDAGLPCEHICVRERAITAWDKIQLRSPFGGDGLKWRMDDRVQTADFLYIRKPSVISRNFIAFLKKVKKENRRCKVLLELPTYPYDTELKDVWHRLPMLWQDRHYRKRLVNYVDRIVTLSEDDEIFGIPTIKIKNGVDLQKYRVKKQNATSTINIGCAARFSSWHGIDRFLKGLEEYERMPGDKRKVHLYLAGEGPQIHQLKRQTFETNLKSCVTFLGNLNQDELYKKVFDRCDIGIECLANHRYMENARSSSLKSREYLAVGMPMVFAGDLDVFENQPVDFALQVQSDDSAVEVPMVVRFYEKLLQKETKANLSSRIRAYAERHIGWEKTFASVIGWLKQQCSEV